MRNPEHDSSWCGRGLEAARRAPALAGTVMALAMAMTACTTWGPVARMSGPDPLTDLADVVGSDPAMREALWLAARKDNATPRAQLHTALLQSVPGHSGFDPGAAEHNLQALLAGDAPPDVATAARARLAELKASGNCQTRVEELRKQVTKIVEIERKMNHREKP